MKKTFGFFLLAALFLAGCHKDPKPGQITVTLQHTVGDKAFVLNEMNYQTNAGHPFSISRLRYYLSDFSFHNKDGDDYVTDMYHLYNVEKDNTEDISFDGVPAGSYDIIFFTFGLDEEKNVDGGLDNTVDNQNMIWPIPGDHGYHYMKYEGRYDSLGTGVIKNFNTHLGPTQNNKNYFTVALDLPKTLKVDDNNWTIELNMDLLEWYQNPHDYDFVQYGQMIMMNQEAQLVLKDNGATVFSIAGVVEK